MRHEFSRLFNQPHAFAAATRHRLDELRIPDFFRLFGEKRGILIVAVITRHYWYASRLHQRFGSALGTHFLDGGGGRADEGDAGLFARSGEIFVLGQESVARMDRLCAAAFGNRDDDIGFQIGIDWPWPADMKRFVGLNHVLREPICVRINRNGTNTHAFTGADDATGNFAAIGDENFIEHESALNCRDQLIRET